MSPPRLIATYAVRADAAGIAARAEALALEQSVEVPLAAVRDARVRAEVVARVESVARRDDGRHDVRIALAYALPSIAFSILFWPIQGLGLEMDLLMAAFPAVYGLAWVCAHDDSRTRIGAALVASAHVAFWRILLDDRFVN